MLTMKVSDKKIIVLGSGPNKWTRNWIWLFCVHGVTCAKSAMKPSWSTVILKTVSTDFDTADKCILNLFSGNIYDIIKHERNKRVIVYN
jgi:hypothetical protein